VVRDRTGDLLGLSPAVLLVIEEQPPSAELTLFPSPPRAL
jgi:hypothetical protein